MIAFLLQGGALGLSAAASPGPLQAYLISETLSGRWRRAALVTLSPLISDIPIVLLILLVLNHLPPLFLQLISLSGGLFLLYLAWGMWKEWHAGPVVETEQVEHSGSAAGALGRGVLINALSPGPYTFWALINGPLLLSALEQSWLHGLGFLLGFYGAFIGGMLALIAVFHQARRLGPRVLRAMTLISLLILALFALLLLARGLGL